MAGDDIMQNMVIFKPHMEYLLEEYLEMYCCLVMANFNSYRAKDIFRERNQYRDRYPDYRVFSRLHERMQRTGNLLPNHENGGRYEEIPQELIDLVLAAYRDEENFKNLSTRVCAVRLGTYHTMVYRILIKNGFHPYHYQKVQALHGPNDHLNRLVFSIELLEEIRGGRIQVPWLCFTDECTVTPNGMFNSRNHVAWADQNPR